MDSHSFFLFFFRLFLKNLNFKKHEGLLSPASRKIFFLCMFINLVTTRKAEFKKEKKSNFKKKITEKEI